MHPFVFLQLLPHIVGWNTADLLQASNMFIVSSLHQFLRINHCRLWQIHHLLHWWIVHNSLILAFIRTGFTEVCRYQQSFNGPLRFLLDPFKRLWKLWKIFLWSQRARFRDFFALFAEVKCVRKEHAGEIEIWPNEVNSITSATAALTKYTDMQPSHT